MIFTIIAKMAFPKTDIPAVFPDDFSLRLQSGTTLETLHTIAEGSNYFYAVGHRAVQLGAAQLDVASLEDAVSLGVGVFEVMGKVVDPATTYAGTNDQMRVVYGVNRFVESVHSGEEFLRRMHYAAARMAQDTPALHAAVEEAVGRPLNHDKINVEYAIGGAAIIRSMQIYIDNRLEVLSEETAEENE